MTTLPGFDISILRARTFAARGEGLTISGRVSAVGLGIPAFVRVILEGPQHEPETLTFDTTAAPLTGDYSVSVLANKDGAYQVYAQVPLLPLPVPAGGPTLPALAESPKLPIAIGRQVDGQVEQEIAEIGRASCRERV